MDTPQTLTLDSLKAMGSTTSQPDHYYAHDWRRFTRWAKAAGHPHEMPVPGKVLATYLLCRYEDDGLRLGTLRRYVASFSHQHRAAGHHDPTKTNYFRAIWKGFRQAAADAGRAEKRQARGLTEDHLDRIRATALKRRIRGGNGSTETPVQARRRGLKEIALIAVMRDALLRRGEATALRWADVEFPPDGTARVLVKRSKTSLTPVRLYLGTKATRDLLAYRDNLPPHKREPDRRVFGIKAAATFYVRIKAACRAAGLGDDGFSGHSPRVGMAQDLTAAGMELPALMVAGRWVTEAMPAHYAKRLDPERGAVATFHARRNGNGHE